MSDDIQTGLIKSLLAIIGTIISGITLHNFKKVQDMPEKYTLKEDVHNIKTELKNDILTMDTKITASLERIHSRLDNVIMKEK